MIRDVAQQVMKDASGGAEENGTIHSDHKCYSMHESVSVVLCVLQHNVLFDAKR